MSPHEYPQPLRHNLDDGAKHAANSARMAQNFYQDINTWLMVERINSFKR